LWIAKLEGQLAARDIHRLETAGVAIPLRRVGAEAPSEFSVGPSGDRHFELPAAATLPGPVPGPHGGGAIRGCFLVFSLSRVGNTSDHNHYEQRVQKLSAHEIPPNVSCRLSVVLASRNAYVSRWAVVLPMSRS